MAKKLKEKFMPIVEELHKGSPYKKKYYERIRDARSRWKSKYGIPVKMSEAVLEQELGKPCYNCGRKITAKNFSLDHIVPIERDGAKAKRTNIQLLPMRCNRRKGILTKQEFNNLFWYIKNNYCEKAQKYILKKLASSHNY